MSAEAGPSAAGQASAGDPMGALEGLAVVVVGRLRALDARLPSARAFLRSALDDHDRLARERAGVRRRLGLPAAGPTGGTSSAEPDLSLAGLRAAQEALVYAHADALPALGDPFAVDRLARHMVELARHLAVVELWIEAEDQRD